MTEPTDKHQQEAREIVLNWLMYNGIALTGVQGELPRPYVAQLRAALEEQIASALSSRDREIREVLEGLRRPRRDGQPCWCAMPTYDSHDDACLAARGLWDRLQLPRE